MKTICQQCRAEIEQNQNGTRKFCTDACKMAFNRNKVPTVTPTVTRSLLHPQFKEKVFTLEEVCNPHELEVAPNMCQTKKEQAEAIYRLDNNDIEELRKAGYGIPNRYETRKHLKD